MKALVTGGAGFIGTNLVDFLCKKGDKVILFDNFSRKGTKYNLKYLVNKFSKNRLKVVDGDIRNYKKVKESCNVDVIYHLAGQTAVTTSIKNPLEDFEINTLGTINLLEASRKLKQKPILIYSSTNKVYGSLDHLKYKERSNKYSFKDIKKGIDETYNMDFHSPYGCSKGSAESYIKDYSRIYFVPTVVFRQSCIYGPMQLGVEDQGWVAHIGANLLFGKNINIYGTGKQVRDLLFIDDLLEAYQKAVKHIKKTSGEVFNIGGGVKNSLSVLEYVSYLESFTSKKAKLKYFSQRQGDQKIFVSDNSKLKKRLDWVPETSYKKGLPKMLNWISENRILFK